MVKHVDLHQLPSANQVAGHFDVGEACEQARHAAGEHRFVVQTGARKVVADEIIGQQIGAMAGAYLLGLSAIRFGLFYLRDEPLSCSGSRLPS